MVVQIGLTIKHIKGHTFPLECDPDADVLGLKVQIWESQKIPIESQRLVFSGKEIDDTVVLSKAGIGEGATLFLVESGSLEKNIPNSNNNVSELDNMNNYNISAAMTPNEPIIPMDIDNNFVIPPDINDGNLVIPVIIPPDIIDYNNGGNLDAFAKERIDYVVELQYWIRIYCIFGVVTSVLSLFLSWISIIPLICCILGWYGTRQLNRCFLVFPTLFAAFLGIAGTIYVIAAMSNNFYGIQFILLFITLAHIMIFCCLWKLISAINRLNQSELAAAQARIMSSPCCC